MSPTNTVPAVATMEGKKSVMEEDKYYWKGGRGRGEGGEGREGRKGRRGGGGREGGGGRGRKGREKGKEEHSHFQ